MNEETIKSMLDQLDEFYCMKDSIEAEKRAMLNEVKVPAEVLALQDKANNEAQRAENEARRLSEKVRQECNAKLAEIQIPDEIRAVLAEIDRQRALVESYRESKQAEYRENAMRKRQEIFAAMKAETEEVYRQVEERKREIAAEFSGKENDAAENIKKLEELIRQAAKQHGKTVKGKSFSAVYVKGRITWNTDMLDGMIALVPQLSQARKEGEPSITIRKGTK